MLLPLITNLTPEENLTSLHKLLHVTPTTSAANYQNKKYPTHKLRGWETLTY
jgi:hypothetical protein